MDQLNSPRNLGLVSDQSTPKQKPTGKTKPIRQSDRHDLVLKTSFLTISENQSRFGRAKPINEKNGRRQNSVDPDILDLDPIEMSLAIRDGAISPPPQNLRSKQGPIALNPDQQKELRDLSRINLPGRSLSSVPFEHKAGDADDQIEHKAGDADDQTPAHIKNSGIDVRNALGVLKPTVKRYTRVADDVDPSLLIAAQEPVVKSDLSEES